MPATDMAVRRLFLERLRSAMTPGTVKRFKNPGIRSRNDCLADLGDGGRSAWAGFIFPITPAIIQEVPEQNIPASRMPSSR